MTEAPIIAAIDFSDSSPLVLRHAAQLAGSLKVPLIAIHVVETSRLQHLKDSLLGASADAHDLSEFQAQLDTLIDQTVPELEVETVVTEGRPVDEIQHLAQESEAQGLIIAANDLTKKRLGNVAAGCARRVPCDVLILRDWQGGDFTSLLLGTDFSNSSGHALKQAARVAKFNQAELHVVHVMYPPNKDSWGRVRDQKLSDDESYEAKCHEQINQRMSDFIAKHADDLDGVKVTTQILVSELPSIELTHYASQAGCDLVIIGTHPLGDLESLFIGTNAERLIHDAPVSVFAVR